MPQENRLSIILKPEYLKKVLDAIVVVNTTLKPYLIALTPLERQELPKMSDGNVPFVKKSMEYAQTNPTFPAYVDVKELKTDLDAVDALARCSGPSSNCIPTSPIP